MQARSCEWSFMLEEKAIDNGLAVAVLERQFRDAALVEGAEAEGDHSLVLLPRCAGERKVQAGLRAEVPGDGGILGRVRGGKIAIVRAVLHVLTVRLQDL